MWLVRVTATNSGHKGEAFIPQNNLKIIIGDNEFDAADIGGLEYTDNIEPTMTKVRECYFELPMVLIKDSFVLRFKGLWSEALDVQVSIPMAAQTKQTPTPTSTVIYHEFSAPTATPTSTVIYREFPAPTKAP